jgi:hypothetical protein
VSGRELAVRQSGVPPVRLGVPAGVAGANRVVVSRRLSEWCDGVVDVQTWVQPLCAYCVRDASRLPSFRRARSSSCRAIAVRLSLGWCTVRDPGLRRWKVGLRASAFGAVIWRLVFPRTDESGNTLWLVAVRAQRLSARVEGTRLPESGALWWIRLSRLLVLCVVMSCDRGLPEQASPVGQPDSGRRGAATVVSASAPLRSDTAIIGATVDLGEPDWVYSKPFTSLDVVVVTETGLLFVADRKEQRVVYVDPRTGTERSVGRAVVGKARGSGGGSTRRHVCTGTLS